MIELRSPPTIESGHQGSWQLVLWAGTPFDYTTPFRSILADMAVALSQLVPSSIQLPAHEEHEDFVEGTLQFGDETLRIYYEHSLSYLTLTSDSEDTLRDVAVRLQTCVTVA